MPLAMPMFANGITMGMLWEMGIWAPGPAGGGIAREDCQGIFAKGSGGRAQISQETPRTHNEILPEYDTMLHVTIIFYPNAYYRASKTMYAPWRWQVGGVLPASIQTSRGA